MHSPVLGRMIVTFLSFHDFKVDYEIPWQKIAGSKRPWHSKGLSNEVKSAAGSG